MSCRKVQEIKVLRGDVLGYVAQGNPKIDTKIAKERHFRTETNERVAEGKFGVRMRDVG